MSARSARSRWRWLASALCLAALACGERAPRAEGFELADVVKPRLAELAAQLAATAAPAPPPLSEAEADELRERVRGLVAEMEHAQPRWRETMRADVAQVGAPAVPILAAVVADPGASDAKRAGALELLGAIDAPEAAERLLTLLEGAPEAWVRRAAVYQLASGTQDWVVPRVLLRLKYELDGETVVWMAHTLAHFGNYGGLDGLYVVARQGASPELRALASQRLAALAKDAGFDEPDALWRAWNSPAARDLPSKEPSLARVHGTWHWIGETCGERFQLRGVDDARFILSHGASWVVEPLCQALHDRDVYTRVHMAQCLERMGPRGLAAGPVLRAALADPACASSAAAALGAIGDVDAVGALIAALAPERDPDLRTAAARALGRLGQEQALFPLRGLMVAEEPLDLRANAAAALVSLGAGDEVAPFLLELLTQAGGERVDVDLAEEALGRWLAARAERGLPGAAERWSRWQELAPPPTTTAATIPSVAEVAQRQAARAALVREELAAAS